MRTTFSQLLQEMKEKYPNYAPLWVQSRDRFGSAWEQELSHHLDLVFGAQPSERWDEAVKGYAEFCTEALRAQLFYERHGRYPASNYQEVLETCYRSADYMQVRYLPGQYISHFIWPHHQRMLRHYIDELLPRISADVVLFYEVGVGCGMYSQETLRAIPGARGVGLDISDYALEFTSRVVKAHGLGERYSTRNQDIIQEDIVEKADLVISQEVLEHLEDPGAFVGGLFRATRDGGWGYITAAVNAAHTDHIYHYKSVSEVEEQIVSSGWSVDDVQVECNYPEKPEEHRPTIVGFLCRKG